MFALKPVDMRESSIVFVVLKTLLEMSNAFLKSQSTTNFRISKPLV